MGRTVAQIILPKVYVMIYNVMRMYMRSKNISDVVAQTIMWSLIVCFELTAIVKKDGSSQMLHSDTVL